MNKTAMIVAYYFPPLGMGGVQRMAKLAKYLPRHGYDVVVLTVKPIRYGAYDSSLLEELPAEVTVYRSGSSDPARIGRFVPMPARADSKIPVSTRDALKRFWPDSKIGWKRAAVRKARKIIREHKIDIVLSSSPPVTAHLIAADIAQEFSLPWVADFRDIWESRPPEELYKDERQAKRAYDLLKEIAENADVVTRVNDTIGADVFLRAETIMSGYDPDDFTSLDPKPDRSRFTLCHMGTVGHLIQSEQFFQAARMAADAEPELADKIHFSFLGSADPSRMMAEAKAHGWEKRLQLHGYLPHRDALRLAATASVYLLSVPPRYKDFSPGKMFDYLALPAPILAAVPAGGEAEKLIYDYHGGLCSRPDDVQALSENILTLYRDFRQGEWWRKGDISQLSRLITARKFAAVFDRVIHG